MMPTDAQRPDAPEEDHGTRREDEPMPSASDDKVLEETARLAREGQRESSEDASPSGARRPDERERG